MPDVRHGVVVGVPGCGGGVGRMRDRIMDVVVMLLGYALQVALRVDHWLHPARPRLDGLDR